MSANIGLEHSEVLKTLKAAYAPDQGDMREHNAGADSLGFGLLHYAFVRNLRPEFALAIGSRYGFIPACIALALKANGQGRLHFIDANYSDQKDGFSQAYGGTGYWSNPIQEVFGALGLHDCIEVFLERTDAFFPRVSTQYGYVYIDGNHSYEGIKYDCEQALQHLTPGGIIAFHDAMVDRSCVDRLPDALQFGVKAYLNERFPAALVLNLWPGLAFVQPAFSAARESSQLSGTSAEGTGGCEKSENGHLLPSEVSAEHATLESRLQQLEAQARVSASDNAELRKRIAEQEERIEALIRTGLSTNGVKQELHDLAADLRDQIRRQDQYYELIARVRNVARDILPPDATVLVVSKGDDQLVNLGRQRGWHFPQDETGDYAGAHPTDSSEAIAWLEALHSRGGDYLLFPQTAFWWLDSYPEFAVHLQRHYRLLARKEDTCVIFSLREPATGNGGLK